MIIIVGAAATSAFGAASWVSQGPFGGAADSVALDASNHAVYAGNFGGGVQKSTDMGLHWAPANTGLGNTTVNLLAASPAASGRVVVGTQNGIWLTTNGGESWSATNVIGKPGDFEGPDVRAVAFSPSDATRVYAAQDGSAGVWRSTDSGAHWTPSAAGITDGFLVAIAVDPTSADIVYTSTFSGHLFRSTDGGETWAESDSGLPHTDIDSILVDPTQPATVVAGTGNGLYRSTDHGASWHPAAGGPPGNSGDKDQTPYGLSAATFGNVPTLYAASHFGGLFASTDHGATWTRIDHDLAAFGPYAFVFDTSAGVAYAALDGDFGHSLDGGVTWSIANDGYAAQYVPTVAFDPDSPNIVFAGTWGNGVFRSTDSGNTWTATSVPAFVLGLLFDRHDPNVAYFVGGNEVGIMKSTDGGRSWKAMNSGLGPVEEFQALAQSGSGDVLLTGDFHGNVYRSTDGGASWHKAVTGLSASSINFLAADPIAAFTFFVATDSKIFRTTDGGVHWAPSGSGYPGAPGAILVDPFSSAILLAGSPSAYFTRGTGAWRSVNGGISWTSVGGALQNQTVETFAADPAHMGVIYAGTFGGGVYRSTDHGATWTPFTAAGLVNENVVGLAVSPHGWALQAGTDSTSTFRYDFPGRHVIAGPGTEAVPKVHPRD
ncbi:MAG TPA: hypothetical protein VFS34_13865 [Thermoanaerobaculia bacterium]|nr:hypothetical protein [Thermoanaerobaculia bacterium]